MCIPHGMSGSVSNGYVKTSKAKKSVKKVSQETFEHGDPDFVDERKPETPKKEKSWLDTLLG